MVKISAVHADLKDASGDMLFVPTDGMVKGHYGACCRLALKLLQMTEAPYGFANGKAMIRPCGGPFKNAVFLGTIADTKHEEYLRSAFGHALDHAVKARATTVVTPLLKGGWRLSAIDAITEMLNVLESPVVWQRHTLDLRIRLSGDAEKFATVESCLMGRGWYGDVSAANPRFTSLAATSHSPGTRMVRPTFEGLREAATPYDYDEKRYGQRWPSDMLQQLGLDALGASYEACARRLAHHEGGSC